MLSSIYRFHGHGSLRFVYSRGSVVRSRYIVCKYITNSHRRSPRLSVVVSKKVIKSAVGRNLIRRRVYEIARPLVGKNSQSVDIALIVVSPEILALDHKDLSESVRSMLAQAGLNKPVKS